MSVKRDIVIGVAAFSLIAGGFAGAREINEHKNMSSSMQAGTCGPIPAGTAKKIAIMGDSIFTEYRAGADTNTPVSRSFPRLLQSAGAARNWSVTLHAVGSTMASQFLPGGNQYSVTQQVKALQPDLVLMDWRANEQLNGKTPTQLKTDLDALMTEIRTTSPNTQFMIVNPPKLWYHVFNQGTYTQADYTAKMFEAAQAKGACWVDMVPAFPQTGPDTYSRAYLPDDIHGNNAGHALYFAKVDGALLQSCP